MTYRCNFRCRFCPYWKRHAKTDRQSVGDFERGAASLAEIGSLFVSLAGGEPFLRRDLAQIVRAVARYHFPFVTTNGWLVNQDNARTLFEAGLCGASVSLDYADASRHDEARGRQGAFDRAVRAIEHLRDGRTAGHQRVNIMAVLMDDNLDQMEPLCRLATDLGVNVMVQPYGAVKNKTDRFTNREDAGAELLRLKRTYPRFLSNAWFLSRFNDANDGGVPGCRAGRAFFNIDDNGDVAVCVERMNRPVANLKADAAAVILRRLRKAVEGLDCRACWYNCRGEVESLYTLKGALGSLPILLSARYKNKRGLLRRGASV